MIQVPYGFRVVKITPSLLTLNLERTERKTIPVRPRVIGRPAPGFEVAEVASDPAEVRVAGPRSRVQEIESAFTEPVSVDGLDRTATLRVNVGLEDPLLRLEEGSRVQVTANVREVQETRTFEGLRVEAQGRSARLTPSRVDGDRRRPRLPGARARGRPTLQGLRHPAPRGQPCPRASRWRSTSGPATPASACSRRGRPRSSVRVPRPEERQP